jgi:ferritin
MQWFVKDQTEEETLALNLLDQSKIIDRVNAGGQALYALDRNLKTKPDALTEDKTALNP